MAKVSVVLSDLRRFVQMLCNNYYDTYPTFKIDTDSIIEVRSEYTVGYGLTNLKIYPNFWKFKKPVVSKEIIFTLNYNELVSLKASAVYGTRADDDSEIDIELENTYIRITNHTNQTTFILNLFPEYDVKYIPYIQEHELKNDGKTIKYIIPLHNILSMLRVYNIYYIHKYNDIDSLEELCELAIGLTMRRDGVQVYIPTVWSHTTQHMMYLSDMKALWWKTDSKVNYMVIKCSYGMLYEMFHIFSNVEQLSCSTITPVRMYFTSDRDVIFAYSLGNVDYYHMISERSRPIEKDYSKYKIDWEKVKKERERIQNENQEYADKVNKKKEKMRKPGYFITGMKPIDKSKNKKKKKKNITPSSMRKQYTTSNKETKELIERITSK